MFIFHFLKYSPKYLKKKNIYYSLYLFNLRFYPCKIHLTKLNEILKNKYNNPKQHRNFNNDLTINLFQHLMLLLTKGTWLLQNLHTSDLQRENAP